MKELENCKVYVFLQSDVSSEKNYFEKWFKGEIIGLKWVSSVGVALSGKLRVKNYQLAGERRNVMLHITNTNHPVLRQIRRK